MESPSSNPTPLGYLSKAEINRLIAANELRIKPLLDANQITEIGIDFRLGYDFLVSIQGREAYINASKNEWLNGTGHRDINQFFQSTRRQIGETFILHPRQTVLAVSLEYIKLPADCLLRLHMRSSYSRLGLTVNTIAQPGYCGCLSLELTNSNNTPINLTIGARLIHAMLFRINGRTEYFNTTRKYLCQVRPEASAVINDDDLNILSECWNIDNGRY